MHSFLEMEEIQDVFKQVRNFKTGNLTHSTAFTVDNSCNHAGVLYLYLSDGTSAEEEDYKLFRFDLDFPVPLSQEKRNEWKKSITDYIEKGTPVCSDLPEYIFKVFDLSYKGSYDYLAIVENAMIVL